MTGWRRQRRRALLWLAAVPWCWASLLAARAAGQPAVPPAAAVPPVAAIPPVAAVPAATAPPPAPLAPLAPLAPIIAPIAALPPPAAADYNGAAAAAGGGMYSLLAAPALYGALGAADAWSVVPRTSGLSLTRAYVSGYGGRPGNALVGPGAVSDLGAFRIDGFEVGDAASPGVPLDAETATAQAVEVSSGGGAVGVFSPGLQINLVQRRGTNEWRASARGEGSGGLLASGAPRPDGLAAGQAAHESVSGDRVRDLSAGGAEAGGPLAPGVAWAWAALDRSRTALTAFGGQPLSAADLGAAAKLDLRLRPGNSLTVAWNRSARDASGEGAGPDRSPESTLSRQDTNAVWRLTDTAVLSPALYANATGGIVRSVSDDTPRGGLEVPLFIDSAGVAHGSWYADDDHRAVGAGIGEAHAAGEWAGGANEATVGAEGRRIADKDQWKAPDWSAIAAGSVLGLPPGENVLSQWRDGGPRDQVTRAGVWLADTLSWSRVTASAGLRFDRQTPANLASSVPGVPGNSLLGPVSFAGNDAGGVRWDSLAPRLALTWSPAAAPRLVLRASLARYAQELPNAIAARVNPTSPASAAYYLSTQPPFGETFWYSDGFDPSLPANLSANELARNLRPEMTNEAVLGGELALPHDGGVGLAVQYRRVTGVLEDRLLVRDAGDGAVYTATAADWVPAGVARGTLPSGAAYSVPYYDLRPGLSPTGGTLLVNGDRQQQLLGAALEWHQRPARRWTVRGHLSYQNWTWHLGPQYLHYADPTPSLIDGAYNGEPVAGQPLPGGRPLYLLSPWSFDLASTVELPKGITATGVLAGRQGLPLAYFVTVPRAAAGPVDLRVADVDDQRTDDLVTLGLRLARDWDLHGDVGVTLSLEALNLLVSGEVLRRETNLGVERADYVDEVAAPRLFRLALRLAFR